MFTAATTATETPWASFRRSNSIGSLGNHTKRRGDNDGSGQYDVRGKQCRIAVLEEVCYAVFCNCSLHLAIFCLFAFAISPSGDLWQPVRDETRICSAHFAGNEKSSVAMHPAYVPTIFPACYGRQDGGLGGTKLERFQRQVPPAELRLLDALASASRPTVAKQKRKC